MKKGRIVGLSLFSGGGICETYFEQIGIHIAVANELLPELGAEFVQAIGRKFTLYRQSSDPEKRQIVLPKKYDDTSWKEIFC